MRGTGQLVHYTIYKQFIAAAPSVVEGGGIVAGGQCNGVWCHDCACIRTQQ